MISHVTTINRSLGDVVSDTKYLYFEEEESDEEGKEAESSLS